MVRPPCKIRPQPNTAMQPTCSIGAFLAFGGTFTLSRFSVSVPFRRTRLMASRWAAVAYEQVLCGVQNGRIGGVRSARRAVILGELPRASFTKRRIPISIKPFRFVRRSFVATDSGNPTPRCNRRPWRGVQDQADFSESLCHLSSSSPPGSRLNANRWTALITLCITFPLFAVLLLPC